MELLRKISRGVLATFNLVIIWHFNCEVKAFCFLLSERGFMGFSECIAKHGVFLRERGNPLNPPYQGDFNATVIRGTLILRLAA